MLAHLFREKVVHCASSVLRFDPIEDALHAEGPKPGTEGEQHLVNARFVHSTVAVRFQNAERRSSSILEIPSHCGKGHPLTPDNVRLDQGERCWRCRQRGRQRAAAFRGRQKPPA